MRASVVIAASIAGFVAGAVPACAADLPLESPGYGSCCTIGYGVAAPVVIYDNQPGVAVRAWWLPPWRNRHYYPHGREKLRSSHRQQTKYVQPRRAPSYARYWTNPPVYLLDSSPLLRPDVPPRRYLRRHLPSAAARP